MFDSLKWKRERKIEKNDKMFDIPSFVPSLNVFYIVDY